MCKRRNKEKTSYTHTPYDQYAPIVIDGKKTARRMERAIKKSAKAKALPRDPHFTFREPSRAEIRRLFGSTKENR